MYRFQQSFLYRKHFEIFCLGLMVMPKQVGYAMCQQYGESLREALVPVWGIFLDILEGDYEVTQVLVLRRLYVDFLTWLKIVI